MAGDEALRQAAQILRDCQGKSGVVARMGGDEFVMYVAGSPSVQSIERLVEDINHRFGEYVSDKFGLTSVGLSIGYSFYPADGTEGQALINAADNAMYLMYLMKHGRAQD